MAKGELFSGLPTWAKGVIAIAVIGGVGFVAYKIYKTAKGLVGNKDEKKVTNENLTEFDKLQKQGQKLSKPLPAYQQLINDIVKKLNGCEDIRTEGQVIEGIISVVKKPVDWYYLVSKFGNRDIEDCGTFGLGKTNYDLPTLLKDQLDTGGYMSINKDGFKRSGLYANSINLLNEYLKTIGITI
jgi:hypothetical protein